MSYSSVPLTSALKEEWRVRAQRPVLTITYTAAGMAGGTSKPRFTEPEKGPDVLPPFILRATVLFAPDGKLWVERTTMAGSPQTFDVFDRTGSVASRVVMPRNTPLVGLGLRSVYVVLVDDDDWNICSVLRCHDESAYDQLALIAPSVFRDRVDAAARDSAIV